MPVDDQEQSKKGTDPEAHLAIGGKRLFQTRDEKTIKRLEEVASDLAESGQHGVGTPGGVEILGPDQVNDEDRADKDDPVAE